MHSVNAEIQRVTDDIDIDLYRVNKVTISNAGSADVDFGFADTFFTLSTGQSTGFETGANSWFMQGLKLKIRFKNVTNTSSKVCNVALCRVVKPSNIFADALQ